MNHSLRIVFVSCESRSNCICIYLYRCSYWIYFVPPSTQWECIALLIESNDVVESFSNPMHWVLYLNVWSGRSTADIGKWNILCVCSFSLSHSNNDDYTWKTKFGHWECARQTQYPWESAKFSLIEETKAYARWDFTRDIIVIIILSSLPYAIL